MCMCVSDRPGILDTVVKGSGPEWKNRIGAKECQLSYNSQIKKGQEVEFLPKHKPNRILGAMGECVYAW